MTITVQSPIAVVGAGTMGAGIAQVAATAGHPVRVIDMGEEALERGRGVVASGLAALVRRGRLDEGEAAAISGRIAWSTDLASAAGAGLLIEAIVERLDAKAALFARAAAVLGGDIVLASNTSSLSIAALAAGAPQPGRVIGLHFFNPVPAMKLVEIVAGPETVAELPAALAGLMTAWAKRPVIVRDVPGFIVNRVARPFYAEGFAALSDGIDPAAVDAALTGAGGFRMGPLALADLIGHDVNFAVATSVYEAYDGRTRFRPQAAQQALVASGRLGRKSGRGVFDYAQPAPAAVPGCDGPVPSDIVAPQAPPSQLVALIAAAEGAGLAVRRTGPSDRLVIDDVVVALGDGRPLALRPGVAAVLDWVRDPAASTTLPFTAADDRAAATVAGFARALGRTAVRLPDRPGQIVLRTLAQLANAAADAVANGVADPQGIDDAMMFGANHPEGPLAWARRSGPATVADALDAIADATGDALYRPAASLRTGDV